MKNGEEQYLRFLTPTSKINFIIEQIETIRDMLEDVNDEICRESFKSI
jgi:predicted transcriptional regulator